MSKYDIKDDLNLRSNRDVMLTSFNISSMEDYNVKNSNLNSKNIITLNSDDIEGRLTNIEVIGKKPDVIQANGNGEFDFLF